MTPRQFTETLAAMGIRLPPAQAALAYARFCDYLDRRGRA